jgi:hypothetical protein
MNGKLLNMPTKKITSNFIKFYRNDKVASDMKKFELRNRKKAVRYFIKRLKAVVRKRYGKESDLFKGIGFIHRKKYSKAGFGRPAYHAHLIEFGTDERFVQNYMGNVGQIKDVGKIKKNPILSPVINSTKDKIIDILSEPWG